MSDARHLRRQLRAREAMHGALLAFCTRTAAEDIVRNVAHPIEHGEPVHQTLRESATLAKHIAEADRDEAAVLAGNAWLRALGEPPRVLRLSNLQRFVLAIGSGVGADAAARAATGEHDH